MNNLYRHIERNFEKLTSVAIAILGNNAVIHAEEKTEHEINILSKEYSELVEHIKQEEKS